VSHRMIQLYLYWSFERNFLATSYYFTPIIAKCKRRN